jgi:hypothetical protein
MGHCRDVFVNGRLSLGTRLAATEFYAGLVRLHILYHASGEPMFQLGMEELRSHGYNLSAGTLYPMPHSME